MKKAALVVICLFAFSFAANDARADFFNVGAEGAVNVPVSGDFGDTYSMGFGGFARATISPFGDLGFLAKIGLLYQLGEDVNGFSMPDAKFMPIILGLHYDLIAMLDIEAALAFTTVLIEDVDAEIETGLFIGAGVELLNFRVAANLYAMKFGEFADSMAFMITAGWGIGI